MDFINFDYKSYQIRHANASTNEEKAAINLELKEMYQLLSAEEKKAFDKGLDAFLIKEKNNLYSQYQAITKDN
jgi:hypothetical protein